VLAAAASSAAPRRELALRKASLSLPAPPVEVIPTDLDGDGRRDLVVVLAYAEWSSIAEDRIEGAVQVTEVVPALFHRREVRLFVASADGGYRETGPPLVLPTSVFAVDEGPPTIPVLAFTEDGISAIRLADGESGAGLVLESLVAEPSVLAGTEQMLPGLDLVTDVDGDATPDVLFPGRRGIVVLLARPGGLERVGDPISLPWDDEHSFAGALRSYPLPRVEDVDGDGTRDLVVARPHDTPQKVAFRKGLGGGRFGEPLELRFGCLGLGPGADKEATEPGGGKRIAHFGDIDGDGKAEVVTRLETDTGRGDLKKLREPRSTYEIHRMSAAGVADAKPYRTVATTGHAFSGDFFDDSENNLRDLDGDGRKDLITVTLDFSAVQAVRVLTTKMIGMGLDFHVYAQGKDGSFALVPDQRLDEKLRLDLDRLEIGRMGQFAGDFDGDGSIDFVHLGRGTSITIHRGKPGCRYPVDPDLTVTLDEEPQDVKLVRVRDLDGDGRADIAITRPLAGSEGEASIPVRMDLHLSGEGR
jgi:hypothetical protein